MIIPTCSKCGWVGDAAHPADAAMAAIRHHCGWARLSRVYWWRLFYRTKWRWFM